MMRNIWRTDSDNEDIIVESTRDEYDDIIEDNTVTDIASDIGEISTAHKSNIEYGGNNKLSELIIKEALKGDSTNTTEKNDMVSSLIEVAAKSPEFSERAKVASKLLSRTGGDDTLDNFLNNIASLH